MKYLLDTDTCIYFLNGNQNIAKKLTQIIKFCFSPYDKY